MLSPRLTYYPIAENLTAFSSTRFGGFGTGDYGEFNVNLFCGDDEENVKKNRQLLCSKLSISEDRLIIPHQVHGVEIRQITTNFFDLSLFEQVEYLEGIDALMTDVKGVCVGVSTADCIPIIIYDPEHSAVCVVHAGWRGTVKRIVRHAVMAMISTFHSKPAMMKALIGPGISFDAFEVGNEVYEEFCNASFPMDQISQKRPAMNGEGGDKWHIDLWTCNKIQLHAMGILPANIQTSGICTWLHYEQYFSARRLGINSGRILTAAILH